MGMDTIILSALKGVSKVLLIACTGHSDYLHLEPKQDSEATCLFVFLSFISLG